LKHSAFSNFLTKTPY